MSFAISIFTRHRTERSMSNQSGGYVLPATILLGVATAILSVIFLSIASATSDITNNTNFNAIAKEASIAGVKYVDSCVKSGVTPTTSLTPKQTCTGSTSTGSDYIVQNGNEWRSKFTVASPTVSGGILTAKSTGTVEILAGSTIAKTFTATSMISMPSTITTLPVATGQVITDIKNDDSACAIANGKLYCWGNNDYGQLGVNSTADKATPTLISGALLNKTVTQVSVANQNVCAIADGTPYCWGANGSKQLGSGNSTSVKQPTDGYPKISSGPLANLPALDIGVASWNNPANLIWPFATAFPHSCALPSNGIPTCWGDNGFRQSTEPCRRIWLVFFWSPWDCSQSVTSYDVPTYTVGYTQDPSAHENVGNPLTTKATNIGASSHDSCALSNGQITCWGVPAPLPVFCWIPPLGQFSPWYENVWTAFGVNPCTAVFSDGYNTTTIYGSQLSGKSVDPDSWNLSTNEGCWMANTSAVCFGTTPAFGGLWSGVSLGNNPGDNGATGWGAPWLLFNGGDVTSADNGDAAYSNGTTGLFCIINLGIPRCAGSLLNANLGSNSYGTGTTIGGLSNFFSLDTTGANGIGTKAATVIAAGTDGGCVVANGQLFCWGSGSWGLLADGSTALNVLGSHFRKLPALTANSVIGTTDGTYAASGPIAVGDNFGCGLVNGNIFCWGDNSKGQLGDGTNDPQLVPKMQPWSNGGTITKTITELTAGNNHACAIAGGKLYCWGDNSYGQLGMGTTGGYQSTPTLVGGLLSGKRVTEVSAGANSTCAVANGRGYCWGNNAYGQLGNNSQTNSANPVAISLSSSYAVTKISVGTNFACAVANTEGYCWGDNSSYQLGDGTATLRKVPTHLSTSSSASSGSPTFGPTTAGTTLLPNVTDIAAGENYACAIINGTTSCWGSNADGRTGRNTTSGTTTVPTKIYNNNYQTSKLALTKDHACAIMNGNSSAANGNLFCWGAGTNGQLGNGTTTSKSTASVVHVGDIVGKSTTNIAVGGNSSCSVSNGNILCWGNNSSGQLGNGSTNASYSPGVTNDYIIQGDYVPGVIY